MVSERQGRVEEDRRANAEEQASQAAIHGMREEDRRARLANGAILSLPAELIKVERAREDIKCALEIERLKQSQADELRRIQEVNARLEHEQEVLRQSMMGTSSPHLQTNLPSASFSGSIPPMNRHMHDPYPYSEQLLPPPQPFYPQPQGGILLQNVSRANISINSFPPPPTVNNINSGNVSSVSLSNVNNNNANCMYPFPLLRYSVLTSSTQLVVNARPKLCVSLYRLQFFT